MISYGTTSWCQTTNYMTSQLTRESLTVIDHSIPLRERMLKVILYLRRKSFVNSHSVRTPFARRSKAQVSCQKVLSQLCAGVDVKTVTWSLTCPITSPQPALPSRPLFSQYTDLIIEHINKSIGHNQLYKITVRTEVSIPLREKNVKSHLIFKK
jgi:hypothetical protein